MELDISYYLEVKNMVTLTTGLDILDILYVIMLVNLNCN